MTRKRTLKATLILDKKPVCKYLVRYGTNEDDVLADEHVIVLNEQKDWAPRFSLKLKLNGIEVAFYTEFDSFVRHPVGLKDNLAPQGE